MARPKPASRKKATVTKNKKPAASKQILFTTWARNRLLILFVAAFAVLGVSLLLYSLAAVPTGPIKNKASGKCLENFFNRQTDGNFLSVYPCSSTNKAQVWYIYSSDKSIRTAQNYCVDVQKGGTTPMTKVHLWRCTGGVPQKWDILSTGQLRNPNSMLCLEASESNTFLGGPSLYVNTCNTGNTRQIWSVPQAVIPTPIPTPAPTPSPSPGPTPSGQAMPTGNLPGWAQVFADDFTGTIPVGAFNDCNHNTDTPQAYCGGLRPYASYFENWWAYPNNWSDTAKSGADGNTGAPFGGTYHPETTTSVNNGALHVHMFRPTSGGDNHVAAIVPRKCMAMKYGRFVERTRVVKAQNGFKAAHLHYSPPWEMDFPESDNFTRDNGSSYERIAAFSHPRNFSTGEGAYSSGARWNEWHTYVTEWKPGLVRYLVDGTEIGRDTNNIASTPMSWILQNESSITGPYAQPGNSAQVDTDWVSCYRYAP